MIPTIYMIKARADLHIERKLTHFFGILGMVAVHHFSPQWLTLILLLVLSLPLIAFDVLRQKNEKLKQLTPLLFGKIMRRKELNHIAGTTYLLIGTIIIFFFFPHNIVSLSLLFLACADPLASFVGLKYGTLKIVGKKTFEGALAAFIICTLISFFFYKYKNLMSDHLIVVTLISGLIGTLTELIPLANIDDNFTQPVMNALLLYGLFSLYGGFI